MAGGDSFGCWGLVDGLCGLVDGLCGLVDGLEASLFPRRRPGGFPATNPRYPSSSSSQVWRREAGISSGPPPPVPRATNPSSSSSQVWRAASPRDAGISSGPPAPVPRATNPGYSSSPVWRTASPRDVRIDSGPRPRAPVPPVARNPPPQQPDDPRPQVPRARISPPQQSDGRRPPVPPVARNPPPQQSDDDDDDDCVIVGQKGEVACRDFPHSRHLCSNMPFATTSHEKHCPMCYCFVCDAPAPCGYWGKGLSVGDHCHATDKEDRWRTLREVFKQRSNGSVTSNGHTAQISRPVAPTVSAPTAHSAAGAGRGTINSHTAQNSRPLAPTVSAPRAHPAAGAGSGTSNTHTAQSSHSLALTVSGPRASTATRVQSGTSNGHSAQVTHPVERTICASRVYPAARAGSDSSNAHSAQITFPATANSEPQQSDGRRPPVARNPPPQQSDDDDDDDDDCAIVGQKGEVACRDFPHSRHLCSNMPFATTSHEKHCPMCYCFVCDAPAPCGYWGRGLSVDDHCHATDKETKWKRLREVFKQRSNGSGTSNGHTAQISRPLAPTVSTPMAHSAAGAGRGTTNGHTAQISRPLASTVSAPRAHPAAGAGRGTSNTHTAQSSHSLALTVSGARASSATRVQSGTRNGHSAQVTHPVEPTISASRVYPAARGGSDSSNAHSAQITFPVTANSEPHAPEGATVYVGNLPNHIDHERLKLSFQQAGVVLLSKVINDRETGQSRGFGFVTMNTVQEAEAAVRMYNGSVVYGRPLTVRIAAPRGSARVDTIVRQSGSPLRIYVCNLPPQVDRPRLEELFSKHGKVVDARVIYERREGDWCSKGFGFVTMATEEESHTAIDALNKQVLEGRALVVKVATERPERGSPSLSNQASLQNAVGQNQNRHTSVRSSPNLAPTVGATRARSSTSSAYTAPVTH